MIADLGTFALLLALAASLAQAGLLLAGSRRDDRAWLAAGFHACVAGAALVGLAAGCLVAASVASGGSPANPSGGALPVAYRVAAAWSSPGGTMFLWVAALAAWGLALRLCLPRAPALAGPGVLALLGLVQAGFLVALVAVAKPFSRGTRAGLDPALQDPAVLFHQPLLAAGATGLAVTFAFAVTALLSGRGDPQWPRAVRPWAIAAWLLLTAGLAAGGQWSDRVAGWGGWWSWARLPTAFLVAWLAATAFLHLLPAAARGGALLNWSFRLGLLPFPLAVLGVWLAGAGPATQEFPYAHGPAAAGAFLALAAALASGALFALARRATAAAGEAAFEMISLETALAANALVLLCAVASVLIGLLHPLLGPPAAYAGGIGPSYFNAVFTTLVVPVLGLMGLAPRLRWGNEPAGMAVHDAKSPALAGLAVVALAVVALDRLTPAMVAGLFLAAWIAWHSLVAIVPGRGVKAAQSPVASPFAMHVAHLGVALLVAGATLAGGLERTTEVAIRAGAAEPAGALLLRVEGAREAQGPNYRAVRVRVQARDGAREFVLEPEIRHYRGSGLPTPKGAVRRGLARDFHVALAGTTDSGSWILRVTTRPFMSLVWAGLALVVLGGLVALARELAGARLAARTPVPSASGGLALGGLP